MDIEKSPLAPTQFPEITGVGGVLLATATSGLKYKGRPDLLLVNLRPGTVVAGVLTKSSAPGNPIIWCKKFLSQGTARGLIVNAGNANVFTGVSGFYAVEQTAKTIAKELIKNIIYALQLFTQTPI